MTPDEFQDPGDAKSTAPPADRRDDAPAPRQFGLRKLMLWTVVAALWCGTATLADSKAAWCVLTGWAAFVVLMRIPFGRGGSVLIGTLAVPAVVIVSAVLGLFFVEPLVPGSDHAIRLSIGVSIMLCFPGLLFATAINIVVELIDSLDRWLGGERE